MKRRKKSWWKRHWDEVMLVVGLLISFIFFLKAIGVF